MLFSLGLGKLGAFFASVPMPIIAALYCVLFGYVCKFCLIRINCGLQKGIGSVKYTILEHYAASGGLGFLQFCNLNNFRTKFVLGLSFFLGLSIPQYFREYYEVKEHGGIPLWVKSL